MPFHTARRHQYWAADIRYLDMHTLGDGQVYAITILENYSRAILVTAVSRSQDLTAYLFVLFAALQQHGCPEALVTDGGAVFLADQANQIYPTLAITHHRIPRRQSWQNHLETNFNVMRRMADWDFARATMWQELVGFHEQWVGDLITRCIGRIGTVRTTSMVRSRCLVGCGDRCPIRPPSNGFFRPHGLCGTWTVVAMFNFDTGSSMSNRVWRVSQLTSGYIPKT